MPDDFIDHIDGNCLTDRRKPAPGHRMTRIVGIGAPLYRNVWGNLGGLSAKRDDPHRLGVIVSDVGEIWWVAEAEDEPPRPWPSGSWVGVGSPWHEAMLAGRRSARPRRVTCTWCGAPTEPGQQLCAEPKACESYVDGQRRDAWWTRVAGEIPNGTEWPYVSTISHSWRRPCITRGVRGQLRSRRAPIAVALTPTTTEGALDD